MKLKNYLLLSAIILFSIALKAQKNAVPKTIKKTIFYSFGNVISETQIEKLKNDAYALKNVTEVKSDYDATKSKGQIIVVVTEKEKIYEGDLQFSILDLKRAIIKTQLSPLEVSEEDTTIEN